MSKRNVIFLVLVAMVSVISINPQSVFSQTADEIKSLRDEIKALKEGQSAIQKDLQEIKSLLRTRQAQPQPQPPSASELKETLLNIDSGHGRGNKNAKLVMIEFSDYQ
jgi:peptidoglycan hydrolase CwlO-like protein